MGEPMLYSLLLVDCCRTGWCEGARRGLPGLGWFMAGTGGLSTAQVELADLVRAGMAL